MGSQHKNWSRTSRSNEDVIPAIIVAVLITAAAVAWGFFASDLPAVQHIAIGRV